MRRTTTTASIGLALAATVTLSGCFANPLDSLVENVVSGGVENLIEGQLGDNVDINIPGSGGSATLPSGWPADVPTPNGEVVFSLAADGAFQASIVVADQRVIDRLPQELEAAGFTLSGETDLGGLISRIYARADYDLVVGLFADEDSGEVTVQYIITPAGG